MKKLIEDKYNKFLGEIDTYNKSKNDKIRELYNSVDKDIPELKKLVESISSDRKMDEEGNEKNMADVLEDLYSQL